MPSGPATTTTESPARPRLLPVPWKVPSGWRIVWLDWERMPEARQPCRRNFLATSAGYFPWAAGHDRERPRGAGEFIFSWLLAGSGWCRVDGGQHVLHPGDVMVLGPDTPHAYGFSEEAAFTMRWFHCRGPAAAQMAAALTGTGPVVQVGMNAVQIALHEEALCALEMADTPGHLSLGSQLLASLVAQWAWQRHPGPPVKAASMSDQLEQLLRYLRSHLEEPHKPGALLATTQLSVKEVAVAVGFNAPLYFSRVFARRYRTPPSRMQRALDKSKP